MSNPMAQSEPVEQRFAVPASNEAVDAGVPTRQIDGTDVVELGTLAAENVLEALKDVIDPELGINIVDLGLVYGVVIGAENQVRLDMTLTSAACPLTDVIERQAHSILSGGTAHTSLTADEARSFFGAALLFFLIEFFVLCGNKTASANRGFYKAISLQLLIRSLNSNDTHMD